MLTISQLEAILNYNQSSHYYSIQDSPPSNFETAHLFRTATEIGVKGIYTFQTSPASQNNFLPPRPAVYVAEVNNEAQARKIHRGLWNLNYAPFLIVTLPDQLRIYTGFNYSADDTTEGNSTEAGLLHRLVEISDVLTNFNREAIDTGYIWAEYTVQLDPRNRVDERLLANLDKLGQVLVKHGLADTLAHALIGKYVYLSYLRHRDILDDTWLSEQGLQVDEIFSHQVTITGLQKLVTALDAKINGMVFPIDDWTKLTEKHVAWVASIFSGAEFQDRPADMPDEILQLHLPFRAYDFRYIPVETLSAIYEQFIQVNRKKIGAIYTPEIVADYLLSEVESVKPLEKGMTVCDPACGSGIFLVLVYRRLIEKELARQGKTNLSPAELAEILLTSIYGVERERDACYITEFSLILTLLYYAEPSALKNLNFRLPKLYGQRIFQVDFFDVVSEFWQLELKFDWVVGNPPWVELKPPQNDRDEKFVRAWLVDTQNKAKYPVSGKRVAEAFSWLVTEKLKDDGMVGLLMPATSLVNLESQKYRQSFFTQHSVFRITNFANLRKILFDGRTDYPAATIIYQPTQEDVRKPDIWHYGPFMVHQTNVNKKLWTITINENEIKHLSPYEAEKGDVSFWKIALWGSYLDKSLLKQLEHAFPQTLNQFCASKGWGDNLPVEGVQLREVIVNSKDHLLFMPGLQNLKFFSVDNYNRQRGFGHKISLPKDVLQIHNKKYLRKRGGKSGLRINSAPHIILSSSWGNYIIYSDENFIIPPRQMGIAAPKEQQDSELYLKLLAVYLASSLATYYIFFQVPEWGIFRQRKTVLTTEVRQIPTPDFTLEQATELAKFHKVIVEEEKRSIAKFIQQLYRQTDKQLTLVKENDGSFEIDFSSLPTKLTKRQRDARDDFAKELRARLQQKIDAKIFEVLNLPSEMRLMIDDFVNYRLPLDRVTVPQTVIRRPTTQELLAYAIEMREELDDFIRGEAYHRVTITTAPKMIVCVIEITQENETIPITEDRIEEADLTMSEFLADVDEALRQQISQWVYVQRGLRLFDGPRIYFCKTPRIIDWTRTQAILDAGDIIGQLITGDWDDKYES